MITMALAERNVRVRAALRRIAAEKNDFLAVAVLNPRPRRDEPAIDDRPLAAAWPPEYRDWSEPELREAFGR